MNEWKSEIILIFVWLIIVNLVLRPRNWIKATYMMTDKKKQIPSLAKLLEENSRHISLLENNKILCHLTKHEMAPRADVVYKYLNSKKYKNKLEWNSFNYDEYKPYIVPHKSNPKKLYCTVTRQELNRIPKDVLKHVSGKKYKR